MRLKRTLRSIAIAAAAIIIVLGLGTLVPRPIWFSGPAVATGDAGSRTILILSSDIHSDIALPADPDVLAQFSFLADAGLDPAQPGVGWIIAGWGSRSFYISTPTWADLKPGPVARALTLDNSVMHMELAGDIDRSNPAVLEVTLSPSGFAALMAAIEASFAVVGDGRPMLVADAAYGEYDNFYEAVGWFNAFAGCNLWTSRMLRVGGLRTGWWTPLPKLLDFSLRQHNPPSVVAQVPGAR